MICESSISQNDDNCTGLHLIKNVIQLCWDCDVDNDKKFGEFLNRLLNISQLIITFIELVFHLQSGLPSFRSKTEKVSHLQLYGLQFAALSNLKHSKFCINSYLCKIYIFLCNRHECKLALRHHKFSSINLHRSLNLSLSDLDIYSITTFFISLISLSTVLNYQNEKVSLYCIIALSEQ